MTSRSSHLSDFFNSVFPLFSSQQQQSFFQSILSFSVLLPSTDIDHAGCVSPSLPTSFLPLLSLRRILCCRISRAPQISSVQHIPTRRETEQRRMHAWIYETRRDKTGTHYEQERIRNSMHTLHTGNERRQLQMSKPII